MVNFLKKNWFYIALIFILIIIRKIMKAEYLNKFINHIKTWEGGLGDSPDDTGAINNGGYAPGTNYHTNMGITWGTFKHYCQINGITPTTQKFIKMPNELWLDIFKSLFWEKWDLNRLFDVYPRFAFFVAECAFMSGNGGAEKFLAQYLRHKGVVDSNITPKEITNHLLLDKNKYHITLKDLVEYRKEYIKSFKGYKKFGRGWTNRLNAFLKL